MKSEKSNPVLIMVLILITILAISPKSTFAETKKKGPPLELSLCKQNPTASIVGKVPSSSSDPCDAMAKIQAIAFECGLLTNTTTFTNESFKKNMEKAQEKCSDYCEGLSSKCTGKMEPQRNCALFTPPNKAEKTGREIVHCAKRCEGIAFNYCSLYHGNFFAVEDRSIFKSMKPNCHCISKKKLKELEEAQEED